MYAAKMFKDRNLPVVSLNIAALHCLSTAVSGARGEAQALEAQRQEAEAGIAALQRQRQPTKVSQKKVDQVKV